MLLAAGALALGVGLRADRPLPARRTAAVVHPVPFAASSPWNTPTPATTQWFDHPVLHRFADGPLHWWVKTDAVVVTYVEPTDPMWRVQAPAVNDPAMHRNSPAFDRMVRAPADLRAGADSDAIVTLVDGSSYLELWLAQLDPVTRTVRAGAWASGDVQTGPGAGTLQVRDGVRASNFSWIAGLITGSDLARGSIDHALVVGLTGPMLNTAPASNRWPATAWDNGGATGPIRMGSKIGVPAGVPAPPGLSRVGRLVWDALQRYGAYVGDFMGGDWPGFYVDAGSVAEADVATLYQFWDHGGSADMEKIGPFLRVADYQP